jgi:hypothetical protein
MIVDALWHVGRDLVRPFYNLEEKHMNFRLTYRGGSPNYSEFFNNFDVKISRSTNDRIKVSFQQKDGEGKGYGSFSLPRRKARQLAFAILTAATADGVESIQFSVADGKVKPVAA